MAIPNKCKDILDDLIDSLDIEFLNWPRLIDKGPHNTLKSESSLTKLLEEDYLNKDSLDKSSRLAPKT